MRREITKDASLNTDWPNKKTAAEKTRIGKAYVYHHHQKDASPQRTTKFKGDLTKRFVFNNVMPGVPSLVVGALPSDGRDSDRNLEGEFPILDLVMPNVKLLSGKAIFV